jgi:hypothetical protein
MLLSFLFTGFLVRIVCNTLAHPRFAIHFPSEKYLYMYSKMDQLSKIVML